MNVILPMSWITSVWAVTGIILLLITAFLYLPWIGFGEQGEVHFAAVSWLLYNGHDLYTAIDSATRYSIQHGPITYLINGAFMKVMGPGFATAKIAGIVSLLFTIIVSWLWYRRFATIRIALLLLGLEVWILLHWNQIYYIRPDIKMLLVSTISTCLVTTLTQRWGIIAGIAIPLGMIINMKIHGIIYFLPLALQKQN